MGTEITPGAMPMDAPAKEASSAPPAAKPIDPRFDVVMSDYQMPANVVTLYGSTSTGKTTQIAVFAKYIYQQFGLRTAYIMADDGGIGPIEEGIYHPVGNPDGWIDLLDMQKVIDFGRTGQHKITPNSLMIALSSGLWTPLLKGKAAGNFKMSSKDWSGYGLWAFDSLSSAAMITMNYLTTNNIATTEETYGQNEDPSLMPGVTMEKWSSPGRTHYGTVQNMMFHSLIKNAPHKIDVPWMIFTALEGVGEDKMKKTVAGPMVIGQAVISLATANLGTMVHVVNWTQVKQVADDKGGLTAKKESAILGFLKPHTDAENQFINWPANCRWPAGKLDKLDEKYPQGFIHFGRENLAQFLQYRADVQGIDLVRGRRGK